MKKKVNEEINLIRGHQAVQEILAVINKFKLTLDEVKRILRTVFHVVVLDYKISLKQFRGYLLHIYELYIKIKKGGE